MSPRAARREHTTANKITNATEFYDSTFEVAVFDANGDFIRLTPHDDVIGHQTTKEVSHIMTQLQTDPESLRVDEFTDY